MLGRHAGGQMFGGCHTRDESDKYTSQGIHHAFETQGRCHEKSKDGLLVASQKD